MVLAVRRDDGRAWDRTGRRTRGRRGVGWVVRSTPTSAPPPARRGRSCLEGGPSPSLPPEERHRRAGRGTMVMIPHSQYQFSPHAQESTQRTRGAPGKRRQAPPSGGQDPAVGQGRGGCPHPRPRGARTRSERGRSGNPRLAREEPPVTRDPARGHSPGDARRHAQTSSSAPTDLRSDQDSRHRDRSDGSRKRFAHARRPCSYVAGRVVPARGSPPMRTSCSHCEGRGYRLLAAKGSRAQLGAVASVMTSPAS